MRYFRLFSLLAILSAGVFLCAQNPQIDSLRALLETVKEDTTRVNMLNSMAAQVYRTSPDEAIKYSTDAKTIAQQIGFQKGLAAAHKNMGLGYYMLGEYLEAFKQWELSLEIYEYLEDDKSIANIIGNQGSIYYTTGKNVEAIESYLRALKIAEKLGDSTRIGTLLLNIGLVYSEQPGSLDTARSYYLRALDIGELIGYQDLVGVGTVNLGELFFMQNSYDSALFYFERSLSLFQSSIDISTSLNYIGQLYSAKEDYSTAIQYHQDALELAKSENAKLESVKILLSLAYAFSKQHNPVKSIEYYDQAKAIAEEIGLNYELSDIFEGLASSYAEIRDYRNAYKYLSLQNEIDNTIYRLESDDKTNDLMFSYQLEKKEDEIEILERESVIEHLRSKRQRAIMITFGVLGLLLLLVAIGFYSRMNFIRKTNEKIRAQRDEIGSQRNKIEAQRDQIQKQHDLVFSQKELITDSISYAQRIQSTLLPQKELMDEIIHDYFVLFKPKDIVSGDFYWIKEVQDHLVIVGADCTGHGVPGAFMSMLGITLLNDMIGDRCFNAPSAILEQLREKIKVMLIQEGNADEQKDGMDMAIAILDKNNRELHFSGANNPLYIIRNKSKKTERQLEPFHAMDNGEYQLFEIKGDKQPIGIYWEETNFTNHSVKLQEDDAIYLFSDGFVDQFGGENRKKFKSLNFKKLLLSIQKESMEKQGQLLEDTFETWRGSNEQIDDVSVVGVRI